MSDPSRDTAGTGRRGILAPIRSRRDALNVVTDASIVFLLVAALLGGLYLFRGARTLLDAGLFAVLASLLWRYRSPAAAFALLLVALMRTFVTLAQSLDTGQIGALDIAVVLVVLFAAIRAVEATLKLIGRFSEDNDAGT